MLFCFPNIASGATLSGSEHWTNLNYLKSPRLIERARWSGTEDPDAVFDIDLGTGYYLTPVACVAIVGHNLSISATIGVIGSASPDFSNPLVDREVPARTLSTAAEAAKYPGLAFIADPAGLATCRYWRVTLSDPDGYAETGFIELANLWIGSAWSQVNAPSYAWSLAYEDPSIIETSIGGEDFFDRRPKYRALRFGLDYMLTDEWAAHGLAMIRDLGITEPLLFVMSHTDPNLGERVSFMGRLRSLNPIENPDPLRYACAFEVKELIG